MTREQLLGAAHAGIKQADYAKQQGVPLDIVKHYCRVHRIDWKKERRKNPEVRLKIVQYAHKATFVSALERRTCHEYPK